MKINLKLGRLFFLFFSEKMFYNYLIINVLITYSYGEVWNNVIFFFCDLPHLCIIKENEAVVEKELKKKRTVFIVSVWINLVKNKGLKRKMGNSNGLPIFFWCITNFRLTTHCFFSTKKKACQEKTYRTEVVFEDKNFQFLSSKTTSVLKNPSRRRILSVAKNSA